MVVRIIGRLCTSGFPIAQFGQPVLDQKQRKGSHRRTVLGESREREWAASNYVTSKLTVQIIPRPSLRVLAGVFCWPVSVGRVAITITILPFRQFAIQLAC